MNKMTDEKLAEIKRRISKFASCLKEPAHITDFGLTHFLNCLSKEQAEYFHLEELMSCLWNATKQCCEEQQKQPPVEWRLTENGRWDLFINEPYKLEKEEHYPDGSVVLDFGKDGEYTIDTKNLSGKEKTE